MGFAVFDNAKHDLGVDLFAFVRDRRRFERAAQTMIRVQSKTESEDGESYFSSPEKDDEGNVIGWWYAESDATHFNDWAQHPSPHILVLTNMADESSYWVHVIPDEVDSTGKGYKILVPASQPLLGAKEKLLDIVEASQAQPSFQGTYFRASAQAAAPGRVLRHALLTPRLIAPHPNAIADHDLKPEEAIALVAAGRSDEFRRVAQASVDKVYNAGPKDKDWRWRMLFAVNQWMNEYNPEPLRELAVSTCVPKKKGSSAAGKVDNQPKERKAAVAVAAAAAQSEIGNWDEAAAILGLADSDLEPVDHAWVEMWKAIVAEELGQFTDGRDHAVEAMKTVLLDPNDPTASAIGAAAASYLFRYADYRADSADEKPGEEPVGTTVNLADLLTLNDTAASWWRAQAIGYAVREYDNLAFRAWAGRSDTDDVTSPTEQLRSVWLSALLAGDIGTATSTAELWSTRVVRARTERPWQGASRGDAELVRALDALRTAGLKDALTLVVERLWRDGDTTALSIALSNARHERWWSPSSAWAHLSLLTACGDLLGETDAVATLAELLKIIEQPDDFSREQRASFSPRYFGLRALATVMPAATIGAQVDALERVLKIPSSEPEPLALHLRQSVYPVVANSSDEALRAVAGTVMTTDWVRGESRWPFLAALRAAGSDAAANEIATELKAGNLLPLQTWSDFDVLPADSLLKIIDGEAESCEAIAREAATIGPAFGGVGLSAAKLVAANLRMPSHARWESLHTLLAEARATSESKMRALTTLLSDWTLVPDDELNRLREIYQSSGGFASEPGLSRPEPYMVVVTAVGRRLGEMSDSNVREQVLSLLPGDPVRRQAAAWLITATATTTPIDVIEVLAADPNAAIRAEAAIALLKSGSSEQRAIDALQIVLSQPGCYVAECVAKNLVSPALPRSTLTDTAVVVLSQHPSARIRSLARRAASM